MKLLLFLYFLAINSVYKAQQPPSAEDIIPQDSDCSKLSEPTSIPFRVGKWLPEDNKVIEEYIDRLLAECESNPESLLPVMQEFQELIENDPIVFMLFSSMFTEVPNKPPYNKNPDGKPQVRDYKVALKLINKILRKAPEYNKSAAIVGLPINAIFDWSMGTKSGFAAFLNDKVNAQLKKVLNEWAKFLQSPESRDVLNEGPNGWLNEAAKKSMKGLVELFECDPSQPYYGFKSWDDFFTRKFRPGKRPLPPEDDSVILNACESAPYRIARGVNKTDTFWIKAQPYSLVHMLANDPLADRFIGGTVYQAFLSPMSYHRWHSPVNGQIVKAYVVDGTYYSEALSIGLDPTAIKDAVSYVTEVATRALIFIQSDNPDIGLMCVVLVGMAEVSSCEITIQEGQVVKKGEQLGMFHFGGSTHCLVFGPEVKLEFDVHGQEPSISSQDIHVGQKIAVVQQ